MLVSNRDSPPSPNRTKRLPPFSMYCFSASNYTINQTVTVKSTKKTSTGGVRIFSRTTLVIHEYLSIMSRNAGSDENGRFDENLLTNLTKFLFLWKFAHKLHFNRLEGPWKSWRKQRIWRFWQNFVKPGDEMLRANILIRLEGPQKSWRFWRNFVKAVDKMLRANILT